MKTSLDINDTKETHQAGDVIIWAIDPFETETKPDSSVVSQLTEWARSSRLEIQPVHILTYPNNAAAGITKGMTLDQTMSTAKKTAEQYLKDLNIAEPRPTEILIAKTPSRKDEIEELLRYSQKYNSACIVVSSHGRSGVQRLVLGSFAENLLLQSALPILFLTHLKDSEGRVNLIRKVLFSTDFSNHSKDAFIEFLAQAKRFHFDIILFHSVFLPAATAASSYGVPFVIPEDYFPNQIKWAESEANSWAKLAEPYGIQVRIIIKDEGFSSQVSDVILSTARENSVGLIAMASESGAFSSLVLGSVGREVSRSNSYPVWIYGPKAQKEISHQQVG